MSDQSNKIDQEKTEQNNARELALQIATFLDNKKAKNIKVLYVSEQTIIADYFVIAGGTSSTHVNSLADEVEYQLSEKGIKPAKVEGQRSGSWILIDYSSVIVHIFSNEQRDFYKLEKLWADGTEIEFTPKSET
jgi:iojap-like ribosome-associated protein